MTNPNFVIPTLFGPTVIGGHEFRPALDAVVDPLKVGTPEYIGDAFEVTKTDIDVGQLQEDIVRQAGRDVAIVFREATTDAPGELRILNPSTGNQMVVDPEILALAVEQNAPRETSKARFVREYDEAETVEAKLDAVRNWAARDLAEERQHEGRRKRMREAPPRKVVLSRREPTKPPMPAHMLPKEPPTVT